MRVLATVALTIAMTGAIHAQTREPLAPAPHTIPQQPSRLRTQQVRVTIEGCVSGKTLVPALGTNQVLDESLLNASAFVLEGPKELMTQLQRHHDTHRERITGIATIPQPEGTTVETQGITKGKTRITSGARVTEGSGPEGAILSAPLPVRLRVQSAEHVEERCSPQRR